MIKSSEVLSILTSKEADVFIRKKTGIDLNNPNITFEDIRNNFRFVGGNESNASIIDMLENGEKGIVERITNAIDAVIEKQKEKHNLISAKKALDIISHAFPKYHSHYQEVMNKNKTGNQHYDTEGQVSLIANDGTKKGSPTFDIIDLGTGIKGEDFSNTILSLHGGNKIKEEQSYLIGAFGQGGSTSLAFAHSTIIISKKDDNYYFTIVRKVHLKGNKNHAYIYLTKNDNIMTLENDLFQENSGHFQNFINSDSGTIVRMIDLEISRKYRERDITKPRMLGDYLSIELYGTPLPIHTLDNRRHFVEETKRHQARYVYGTKLKLRTWGRYVEEKYSGNISINHNGYPYSIKYYVILPPKKEDWINDNKCKETYEMFNPHLKQIFFTVNGQYINGENYTKLSNRGLNFLKYRLLVHVDLDLLGNQKYQFFTTDRSRIKDSDLTTGFVDKVVNELAHQDTLMEINKIIGEMSIQRGLDEEELEEIKKDIKTAYKDFLIPDPRKKGYPKDPKKTGKTQDLDLNDYIKDINITNKQEEYYKNQNQRIILKTEAYKDINEKANIKAYVNDKEYYIDDKSSMNGRIQYVIDDLPPGDYELFFIYFYNDNSIQSNSYYFTILNEIEKIEPKGKTTTLDLEIEQVKGTEYIVNVTKNPETNKITVRICLTHEYLSEFYINKTDSEITQIKHDLIKPLSLMALYNGEIYDNLEVDKQNSIMKAIVNTLFTSKLI